MPEGAAPAKICISCGQDCSRKPRSKDKQGRYTCDECSTRPKAAGALPTPNGHATDSPMPIVAAPADDGTIPFLDEESVASKPTVIACPNCARPLASDAMICMGCGFNRATGRNVTTAMGDDDAAGSGGKGTGKKKAKGKGPPRKCSSCGHDLSGLKSLTCPECGKVNPRPNRRDYDREEARRVVRNAWVQPIIMTAVGLTVSTLIVVAARGEADALAHLILFGASLIIGLAVYIVCSFLWIGFDEPLPMTALRLMGVYALADIGYTLVGLVPMSGFGVMGLGMWIAPTVVYFLLLAQIMELDIEDAVIVAVATSILKIYTFMFIAAKLAGL